jgi:hypothetical protein
MVKVKCYKHGGKEFNLRVLIEDLIEVETKRAGKGFANQDAPMKFSDASRIFNASLLVMRVLGWAWRWAEWWVEHGSNWEPLLEPGQNEEDMSPEELKKVDSTQESRRYDARRCRLAAFGAALRNRDYDVEDNGDPDFIGGFDHRSLQQALRAVLHTPSLVGPLENYEIDFLVDSLGRAYRSKSRLLAFGSDKVEIGNKGGFCLHKIDGSPKYELGPRALPGKQELAAGEIFEETLEEADDFDFYIEKMAQNNAEYELAEEGPVAKTKKNRGKRGPGRPPKASSPVDPPKQPILKKLKLRSTSDDSTQDVSRKRGRPPNPKRVVNDVVSDDKAEETPPDTSASSGHPEDHSPLPLSTLVPLRHKIQRTRTRKRQRSAAEIGHGEESVQANNIPSSPETAEDGKVIDGEVTDGNVGGESQEVTKDETPHIVKRGPGRPPKNAVAKSLNQTEEVRPRKRRRVLGGTPTSRPTDVTEQSVPASESTPLHDTMKSRSQKRDKVMGLEQATEISDVVSQVAEASEVADEEALGSFCEDDCGEVPVAAVVEHSVSEDSSNVVVAPRLLDDALKPAAARDESEPQASAQTEHSNELNSQTSSAENAPDEKNVLRDTKSEGFVKRPPTKQKEEYIRSEETTSARAIKKGNEGSECSLKLRQTLPASPTENAANEKKELVSVTIDSIRQAAIEREDGRSISEESNAATPTVQEGHQLSATQDVATNGCLNGPTIDSHWNSEDGGPAKEASHLTEEKAKPAETKDQDHKNEKGGVDAEVAEEDQQEDIEEKLESMETFLALPGNADSKGQLRGRLKGKFIVAQSWRK